MTLKTAKTVAALEGRARVTPEDVEKAAELALPHRVCRQPFQNTVEDVAAYRAEVAR